MVCGQSHTKFTALKQMVISESIQLLSGIILIRKNLVLDREYVKTLHHVLGGKAGRKFYVIAPIAAMGFMEDEIEIGDTTYVFLKVPPLC